MYCADVPASSDEAGVVNPCHAGHDKIILRIKQRPTDDICVKGSDVVHHEACPRRCTVMQYTVPPNQHQKACKDNRARQGAPILSVPSLGQKSSLVWMLLCIPYARSQSHET